MFIKKCTKNLLVTRNLLRAKNLLLALLLISSVTVNQNSAASCCVADTIATGVFITGAATICVGITCLSVYFTYQRSKAQYKLLEEFHENPCYRYENFIIDVRDLYFEQTWGASSTSLDYDYPVIWLEKTATSNKNFLGCFIWKLFNEKYAELSKKMGEKLNFLRKHCEFIREKKEYNEKRREQDYRDTRISLEQQKLNVAREKLNMQRVGI